MQPQNDAPVGQEPTPQPGQEPGRDYDKEIAELRQEAAKWRSQLRDAQGKLQEYQPLVEEYQQKKEADKSEAEKLAERLAALEGQLNQAKQQAEIAQKERALTVLATKQGVPADMLQYLDVNKFNLEDEESVLEALSKLVPAKQPSSGGKTNPARTNENGQLTPAEWYANRNQRNYMFGEK